MDTNCGFRFFLIVFVLCLLSVDIFCVPVASPDCLAGDCKSYKTTQAKGDNCKKKCPCKNTKKCTCVCPTTTTESPVDSSTPVETSIHLTSVTFEPIVTTDNNILQPVSDNSTTSTTGSSITDRQKKNALKGNNETSDEKDKIFSNDFIIGMVAGALAVGIVVIITSITCFVCYTRNQRMRKEIIESYEKRYEKESGIGMIGNEAYSSASLRGGFFSASASTLRTSVSPDACYAEVEDDMSDKRISHCSLPEVMDRVVDPTSGYAFYKSGRPSVYSGFHGNNTRAKNTSYGLHRIDRPTIYTGLKRDTNHRQHEEDMSERVYAEAKEVLPERVLQDNNNDQTGPSHTYMKLNDKDSNESSSAAEIRPSALPVDVNHPDIIPGTASPVYFQVNKDNEIQDYQMLEKNGDTKDTDNECSEYQSLRSNIPGGATEDNRLPTYFTLEK